MAIKGQPINVTLTAIDASTGKRKTGDSANISVYLVKDGTAAARNDATAISETDATNCPGEYTVELDATDMNANTVVVTGKSSTANIEIVPVKIVTEIGKIASMQGNVTDILTDTGTTLDTLIKDVPTVAEFNARTIVSANYALDSTVAKDATVAKAATALSNVTWTDAKAGYLTGPVALEATLTAIKGAGWTTETLAAIDVLIDAIKAKTDNLPAQPAAVGSAMAVSDKTGFSLTSAYDPAKDAASATNLQGVADTMATQLTVGAIKAKTDNLPVDPASDTSVNTRLAAISYSAPDNAGIADIKTATDQLTFTTPGRVDATATASVDEAAIAAAVVSGLGGATVAVVSPVSAAGDIEILRGVAYTTDITINITGFPDLIGYTAYLNCAELGIVDHAGTITAGDDTGEYTITIPYTASATIALDAGGPAAYSITFKDVIGVILSAGIEGSIVVKDWAGT